MAKLHQSFKSVFSYAAGMETWVNKYFKAIGRSKLKYTFVQDFAIADWYNTKSVKETYQRVIKEWKSDYKALTEVAMSLNMLAWAHDTLRKQGIEGRDEVIGLYNELYYKTRDLFYEVYKANETAREYYFEMTD